MKTSTESIASLLDRWSQPGQQTIDRSFWGFGGVHGGLSLALLTAALSHANQGRLLRSVTGQFRRAVRDEFQIVLGPASCGKTISWASGDLLVKDSIAVTATAVFSEPTDLGAPSVSTSMPSVPGFAECSVFSIPPTFVPFGQHLEIRPVGTARPYAGGVHAELLAWVRLLGDETPPDALRLIILFDALAPSYAAILRTPIPIPTVSLSVHPALALKDARSPWLLLRARTEHAGADGWGVERLDAWTPEGTHLGSAEQIRCLTQKP